MKNGAGAQEEDLFRRTDMSRHSSAYHQSTPYLLSESDSCVAMITEGVTILRGPENEGYPFLEDVPLGISSLSMAAKSTPQICENQETNETTYQNSDDKLDMTLRTRLMLHAIIESDARR